LEDRKRCCLLYPGEGYLFLPFQQDFKCVAFVGFNKLDRAIQVGLHGIIERLLCRGCYVIVDERPCCINI
jgi:hypothetical protein